MLSQLLNSYLLFSIILVPILGSIILLFLNNNYNIRMVALNSSLISFVLSIFLWTSFDNSTAKFQFIQQFEWLPVSNISFIIGVDGISLFFVLLTTLLFPLCILHSWVIKTNVKEYMICFLLMESLLIIVFTVLDVLLFYVFFESILIPMFIIIGVWGSRERKIRAAYMLFLYTLLGSVLMLLAILYMYFLVGTTDYQILASFNFDENLQRWLWLAFFASFAVKIPMLPFHIWLPEAHVEAPTAGSVILAGILLKLGSYGFIRFSMPLFPLANTYFTPLVYTMSVMAIIYASLTAIRQTDMKRIIAYSSVGHMNLVLVGLFSLNMQGVEGSLLLMLGHGIVSSALFLCVGVLYDRHHTRMVKYYSGVAHTMPIFVITFMLFTMANIGFPGTCNFVGEFLCLIGVFQSNVIISALSATGMVLGGGYALWLFNRIAFGNIKMQYIKQYSDMNRREFFIFLPLIILTFVMGIYPDIFFEPMHVSVGNLIEQIKISHIL